VLVKENDWEWQFKVGEKFYAGFSKFHAFDDYRIEASELRKRWPTMDESERRSFASNFYNKSKWTDNDTQMLEILMELGDDYIWRNCSLAFLNHPDRQRIVSFLLDRVQNFEPHDEPLNYIQALGLAKDRRATPVIRPFYDRLRAALEAEKAIGVPENVSFGPIPYHAYFATCAALLQIEGTEEYAEAIRKYLDHPNEQVRYWAEYSLGIEGPITKKRQEEFRERRARESKRNKEL
jgi:hypothetical protein